MNYVWTRGCQRHGRSSHVYCFRKFRNCKFDQLMTADVCKLRSCSDLLMAVTSMA